jgi:hypothetical protein
MVVASFASIYYYNAEEVFAEKFINMICRQMLETGTAAGTGCDSARTKF